MTVVLVADPPWSLDDDLPGPKRGARKHYTCLDQEALNAFPLPESIAGARGAVLFLWRLASMPREALDVVDAWGFTPKTEIVWLKRTSTGKRAFGMGRITRGEHETCIVATRGRPKVRSRSVRSTFEAPVGRHSEKPDAFFALVAELYGPPGPSTHVELFARRKRAGWTTLGNEIP